MQGHHVAHHKQRRRLQFRVRSDIADAGEGGRNDLLVSRSALGNDAGRARARGAMLQQFFHGVLQARQSHVKHGSRSVLRQCPPIGFLPVALCMTRHETHAMCVIAMGQWYARVGGCP